MSEIGHRRGQQQGAAFGLASAVLFGAGAPFAKRLLPASGPFVLAALLYLGAGLGLTLVWIAGHARRGTPIRREATIGRGDLAFLAGSILTGGILGPILLLVGLARLSAVAASLLLNLEALFTILVAVALFGEHLGRRSAAASVIVLAGAAFLGYRSGGAQGEWLGALAVAGATLAWAIDNNLTQKLPLRYPVAVT